MNQRIGIAIDSFKGCLSSKQAADAVASAIADVLPEADIFTFLLADGGEGSLEAIARAKGGEIRKARTVDPLLRPIEVRWLLADGGCHAVVEMAAAVGLPLLVPSERSAMAASSFGFGILILEAIKSGARTIDLCLGGSATNDAGLGALQALGLELSDLSGRPLSSPFCGALLSHVGSLSTSSLHATLSGITLRCLRDAAIPFCGPDGAVALYSAQKGASAAEQLILEQGMNHVAALISSTSGIDPHTIAGAGAAGGACGGFAALAGALSLPGAEEILSYQQFQEIAPTLQLIITGEGSCDRQTLQGKGPAEIARIAGATPVVVLAGCVSKEMTRNPAPFAKIYNINENMSMRDAMRPAEAARRLQIATRQMLLQRYAER